MAAASSHTVVVSVEAVALRYWQWFRGELHEFRHDVLQESRRVWAEISEVVSSSWKTVHIASNEADNLFSLFWIMWWTYGLLALVLHRTRSDDFRDLRLFDFRGTMYSMQLVGNAVVALLPEAVVKLIPAGGPALLYSRAGMHAVVSVLAWVLSLGMFVSRVLYLQWRFERTKRTWARLPRAGKEKKKIAIFYASIGSGHKRAAEAIQKALKSRRPSLDVRMCDMLDFAAGGRDNLSLYTLIAKKGYMRVIQYSLGATLYGWFFEKTNLGSTQTAGIVANFFAKLQRAFFGSFYEFLYTFEPDFVINTHFLPADLIGQLQDERGYDVPHVTVVTDYDAHRVWANLPCTKFFAPREEAALMLQYAGVPQGLISSCGIPIVPSFLETGTREQCRKSLGLGNDLPVVVQMSGGRDVFAIYKALLEVKTPTQFVVITGRQADVRSKLENIAVPARHRVKLEGFTKRMHDYLTAADLLVSKPGGLTTAEALATGTPMVIVNPIPGQESRNTDMLLEEGVALKINDTPLISYRVDKVLGNSDRLMRMQDSALKLGDPHAAFTIADWVLRYNTTPSSPTQPTSAASPTPPASMSAETSSQAGSESDSGSDEQDKASTGGAVSSSPDSSLETQTRAQSAAAPAPSRIPRASRGSRPQSRTRAAPTAAKPPTAPVRAQPKTAPLSVDESSSGSDDSEVSSTTPAAAPKVRKSMRTTRRVGTGTAARASSVSSVDSESDAPATQRPATRRRRTSVTRATTKASRAKAVTSAAPRRRSTRLRARDSQGARSYRNFL